MLPEVTQPRESTEAGAVPPSNSVSKPCRRQHAPELLHVLRLPDLDRAERIGEFWSYPQSRSFAELLIDAEEEPALRAVLVGMLAEMER